MIQFNFLCDFLIIFALSISCEFNFPAVRTWRKIMTVYPIRTPINSMHTVARAGEV